jgi:hypothetical protein
MPQLKNGLDKIGEDMFNLPENKIARLLYSAGRCISCGVL